MHWIESVSELPISMCCILIKPVGGRCVAFVLFSRGAYKLSLAALNVRVMSTFMDPKALHQSWQKMFPSFYFEQWFRRLFSAWIHLPEMTRWIIYSSLLS